MRESWTDERLDDLNGRVSDGFERVEVQIRDLRGEMNERFDKGFGKVDTRFEKVDTQFDKIDTRFDKVDAKFERIDGRLDSIQRTMAMGALTLAGTILAGFASMIVLIATQL
jgi:hypothetical protein